MTEQGSDPKIRDYVKTWIGGIGPEIGFWSMWIRTKGFKWPEDYQRRMLPAPKFILDRFLDDRWPVQVLDVGSGPFSPVGIASARGLVELHACDPLAPFYHQLYENFGITPYVRPEFAFAEALTDRYAPESFDVVHMSNALDHSCFPAAGIMSMLAVVRAGGLVILSHSENEAVRENYKAFHQWNITEQAGQMIVWRGDQSFNLSEQVGEFADISVWRMGEGNQQIIQAKLTRNSRPLPPPQRYKNQFDAEMLMALYACHASRPSPEPTGA